MANEVLVDVTDGIMTVTLNRPEAKNAANKAVAVGVAAAMDQTGQRRQYSRGHSHRRRRHVLRRHGPESLCQR